VNKIVIIIGIILGAVIGGAGVWFYERQHSAEAAGEKKEEKKKTSFVQEGTNGETFLKIDKETQARMGLKTAVLAAVELKPEVRAYGRVLDPAPLTSLLVESASAKAALDASTKEYERLKALHNETQNVSTRSVEAAEAAMKRDQILFDSVQPRLLLVWGKAVASQPELSTFVRSLASEEAALVRVDLPFSVSLKSPPARGRLAPLTSPEEFADAQLLGPAPSANPLLQGQGFLFLQKPHPLPSGASVIAWLTVPGPPQSGVNVPREALVRHEGEVFVYLQTSDDTFTRKELELDRPTPSGWFVREGLKTEDTVVVVGTQQLLSEEVKGPAIEE